MSAVRVALARTVPCAVAALVALAAVMLAGTGAPAGSAAPQVTIATPLATSITTTDGTWATVPMGHLDKPLDTFWQLLYRAPNATTWSDEVQSTAVATNGGVVMAARQGQSVTVGIRPSNLLTYSPLLSTADAGRQWTNGLLPAGLSPRPAGLATDGDATLALVGGGSRTRVVQSASGLSSWSTLVTSSALANTAAGRACGVGALTAVTYLAGDPVVGTTCTRPGVVGMFVRRRAQWQLAGPKLLTRASGDTVQVVSLVSTSSGTTALLGTTRGNRTGVLAAWTGTGATWQTSPTQVLVAGDRVASVGPAGEQGMFVLATEHHVTSSLVSISGPGSTWQQLPSPPASTETVAFGAQGGPQALAVSGKVLTVWGLPGGSGTAWSVVQTLHVALQYGSST